jgi:type I restriction enzyme M protein
MAEGVDTENQLPEGYNWKDLESQNAASRLEQYKILLIHLGTHGSQITKAIYANTNTVIRELVRGFSKIRSSRQEARMT